VDSDEFIIRNLPLYLAESARTWLEHLPSDRIKDWEDLREVFVGNFQGTYAHPRNPWDLKNCWQKADESLCEYIRCFSKQCNELPNVGDTDVIGAFLSGTTCESLVHKLGHKSPQTMKELLDIATSHASGEEAVGAIFDCSWGKVKRRTLVKAASTAPKRKRKTGSGSRTRSLPPSGTRVRGRLPRAPWTTSRNCSKGRARTMPFPSNACTRIAAS
jgi:hypothetical protein